MSPLAALNVPSKLVPEDNSTTLATVEANAVVLFSHNVLAVVTDTALINTTLAVLCTVRVIAADATAETATYPFMKVTGAEVVSVKATVVPRAEKVPVIHLLAPLDNLTEVTAESAKSVVCAVTSAIDSLIPIYKPPSKKEQSVPNNGTLVPV
jgi:hypothetical protein